jgi:hypothetical protein
MDDSGASDKADRAASARAPQRRERPVSAAASLDADRLRKPVNTLAIVPKSTRITALARKAYNVLLFEAQEQGLENNVFRAPLERIIKTVDFDSHDHGLVKKHLRAMVATTVEWQSPTTGEGSSWNVSGLLAHARLSKERGQIWVEWSYAINLKQELLEPTVFARIKLEVISQLRSHAGVALYEICTRYREVGRTSRQPWRWWVPVLTGNPPSDKSNKIEYRIFKRDTLKKAIAEVSGLTDLDIELVEHRHGRMVDQIQFSIVIKKQAALALGFAPSPVDLRLINQARSQGVSDDTAEALLQDFGEGALSAGLAALERRQASDFPEPLRDPSRYLRSLMPAAVAGGTAPAAEVNAEADAETNARLEVREPPAPAAEQYNAQAREIQAKRQARWAAEWLRRRRNEFAAEIAALAPERQAELVAELLADMERRSAHPSIVKRLRGSGWQHPMVVNEMLRFYAQGAHGERWDQPDADALLRIAAEIGEAGEG